MKKVQVAVVFISLSMTISLLIVGCGGSAPSQASLPDVSLVTIDDGERAIEQGDFEGAADIFAELILQNPSDPVLRYYLGLSKDNMGDDEGAITAYQKALELNSGLTSARLNLGLVYFDQGNLTAAITEFEAVAKAEPDAADAQYNLAMALAATWRIGRRPV